MPECEATTARKRVARRVALGLCLLASALACGFLALWALPQEARLGGRPGGRGTQWVGYRILLVESAVPEAEVLDGLSAAGLKDLLSESTAQVLVSDWSGIEAMNLAEARARLVQGDPRLDGYLQRSNRWFEASSGGISYRAYYIKEDPFGSGALTGLAIERGLTGQKGRYLLPDGFASGKSRAGLDISFACALALIILACASGPLIGRMAPISLGRRLDRIALRLSLALPWVVLAGGGLGPAALAGLWGLAIAEAADSLDLPLDEHRRGGGIRAAFESLSLQGLPSLALPLIAFLASLANVLLLPSLGLALLGSLVAAPGYALASARPSSRRRFIPMPIMSRSFRRPDPAAGKARAVLAAGLVLAWGLCLMLSPSLGPSSYPEIVLPRPEAVRGSLRPLLAEARQRARSETGDVLPGLASYLEHKARQEALPFSRIGETRPDPFAPARLPVPPGTPVAAGSLAGVEFSDEWARDAYASVSARSIEAMLLRQGSAMVGRVGPVGPGGGLNSRPLAPIQWLLYIFLLVPPIGRILFGAPDARRAASGELRQEA